MSIRSDDVEKLLACIEKYGGHLVVTYDIESHHDRWLVHCEYGPNPAALAPGVGDSYDGIGDDSDQVIRSVVVNLEL